MSKNEHKLTLENIFLLIQWQRVSYRSKRFRQREAKDIGTEHSDPAFGDFRKGSISKADICNHLDIHERDLLRTLVETGELFGD